MNHSLWGPKKWVGIEPLPALFCLLAQPEFAENVFCYVFFVCFRSGFLILALVSHTTKNNDQIKHKYFGLCACQVSSVLCVFLSGFLGFREFDISSTTLAASHLFIPLIYFIYFVIFAF